MKNENEILDKTYTLNSERSYFNSNGFCLNTLLPIEDPINPYSYTVFDLTQMIDGVIANAILVLMKKRVDNGNDLSGSDDDLTEVNNTFGFSNLEKLNGLPGQCDFEDKNDDTLVIICHDCAEDMPYKTECAEKVYELVASIRTSVINNGNFQTTLNVMGNTPRKTGMSSVPKR